MPTFNEVSSQPDYKQLEATVLEFWKSNQIFERSSAKPAPAGEFVFFEGPPTANGQPAMHHVLARAFKDLFPRFKTMKGFHVTRKGGWDTHGLPVEISVEKKLGMRGRNHGATRAEMEEFNRLCRESVFTNIQDWNEFTQRMGYWVDLETPYVTYHNAYIESVWNLLKRMWDRGLVERDFKVVPVSPRIGSTLSKAELGDENSYQMVDDPSVYVRFPVKLESTPEALKAALEAQGVRLEDLETPALIVWTTTPWTLPSNTMAAVNPNLEYALVQSPMGHIVVASSAVERMGGLYKEQPLAVVATFKGELLEWWQYEQPFPEVFEELGLNEEKRAPRKGGARGAGTTHPRAHFVALAEFVGDEDGSGIAHEAPVYGAEDLELSKVYDAVLCFGTNGNGIMQVTDERGKFFKDADKGLIKEMKSRGVMYHAGTLKHRYPFHDRTGDPILYFARPSWFVRTHKMATRMVETNQEINWVPEHIKNGRFGNWLSGNVDWGISRERYWGTPLPFWVSEDGKDYVCVGSVKELEALMGKSLENEDLHRPYIDDATFTLNGKTYTRVPEVLDVWFDSGAMPYAQWHVMLEEGERRKAKGESENPEPFALRPLPGTEQNLETFNKHFPADFISEAIDQTRGWFYSLHAISTLLYDQPAFKNVICLGHLVDEKGAKMSKSKGNVVEPLPAFDKYGADSVRWYMFTATEPGDVKRFSERLVAEAQRGFVNTFWNVYAFFVLYANLDKPDLKSAPRLEHRPEIDRWLVSSLEQTVKTVNDALEVYDARKAGKALEAFAEGLSNWYVRRNRSRFWTQNGQTDSAAYATLHEALTTVAKLSAPFTPFLAEKIYRNLVLSVDSTQPESVHLCNYPEFNANRFDASLSKEMELAIRIQDLANSARGKENIRLRQPLSKMYYWAYENSLNSIISTSKYISLDDLNVKKIEPLPEELLKSAIFTVLPDFHQLSKRKIGKDGIPNADVLTYQSSTGRRLLNGNDIEIIKHELKDVGARNLLEMRSSGRKSFILPGPKRIEIWFDEITIKFELYGLAQADDDYVTIAFEKTLTRELVLEGIAKDLQRAVQQARKDAGLEVSNRIALRFELEGDTLEALKAHAETIKGETLASSLEYAAPLETDFVVVLEEGGRFGLAKV